MSAPARCCAAISPDPDGAGANLQETCVVHSFPNLEAVIEEESHIGHGAILHGCRIGRNAMVGMNAGVMDEAFVGENAIVAALAFVKERGDPARQPRRRLARQGGARPVATGNRVEAPGHRRLPPSRRRGARQAGAGRPGRGAGT
jgi:carbonic anhydrase/acetyltransferase-like protein (isoleucine patch superfamily)